MPSVQIDEEIFKKLEEAAKEEEKSIEDLINEILKDWLIDNGYLELSEEEKELIKKRLQALGYID